MQNDCFPDATQDWPKSPLSVLAQQNPRYPVKKGTEYPFIEMASVGENFRGILKVDSRKMEGSGLSRFKANDTLFAKITPCPENGKIAFVRSLPAELGIGSTEFIVLSPREATAPRFLFHLVCSHAVRGRATTRMEGSTGRQRIPDDVFDQRLLVPIPGPDEQAAIARVLDAVDAAIERARDAVAKARLLRVSLLQDLTMRCVKHYATERLDVHIAEGPTNGLYRPESDYRAAGTPIVRIDSFADGAITGIDQLRRVTVPNILRERFSLSVGDVLVNRVNALSHVGKAAIVPHLHEPTIFESNMMRLRCGQRLLPEFLIVILQSDIARRHWLARAKPAVNQVSVNQRDVKDLQLPIPDKKMQRDVAGSIAAADEMLLQRRSKLIALETLKRSLMHDLLAGTVRVDPALFKEEQPS